MARIGLLHRDHSDPIATALGRQPKIDDLGELLAQERDKDLVQGLAQHARLVWGAPRKGGQIDRLAPHGDGADLKDRERLDRIIIAGMVAVRALVGIVIEQHMTLNDDLGLGGDHQGHGLGRDQLGLGPAQETGELIFGQGIGNRRHSRQDGARISSQNRAGRQGLALAGLFPATVMLRPAPVGQPAHDGAVLAQNLHPIDAQIEVILAVLARTLGDNQRPCDQGGRLARPAGLDRQLGQVDLIAGPDDLLNRGLLDHLGPHRHDGLDQRQHV